MAQQTVPIMDQTNQPPITNPAAATATGGTSGRVGSVTRWLSEKVRGTSSPDRPAVDSRHSSLGARPRGTRPYRDAQAAARLAEAGSSSSGGHGGQPATANTEAQGRTKESGTGELARKSSSFAGSTKPADLLSLTFQGLTPELPTTAPRDRRPTYNAQLVAQGHRGLGTQHEAVPVSAGTLSPQSLQNGAEHYALATPTPTSRAVSLAPGGETLDEDTEVALQAALGDALSRGAAQLSEGAGMARKSITFAGSTEPGLNRMIASGAQEKEKGGFNSLFGRRLRWHSSGTIYSRLRNRNVGSRKLWKGGCGGGTSLSWRFFFSSSLPIRHRGTS